MALPSPNLLVMFPLQQVLHDKSTGALLAGGSITFYIDNTSTLKPIYQQTEVSANVFQYTALPNPLTLSSIGSTIDNSGENVQVFMYPYVGTPADATAGAVELYSISVASSTGVAQFSLSAQPPGVTPPLNPSDIFESTTNELGNTQFSAVLFTPTSGYTYTVSGSDYVSSIAPDWDVVTSGTGTFTVKQVAVTEQGAPSSPPYALDIIGSAGLTKLWLRQRLTVSSRLLTSSFVSGTFVAQKAGASEVALTLNYAPSNSTGAAFIEIAAGTTTPGGFATISGVAAITINNVDNAPSGYVDIYIDIPIAQEVQISSVQVVGVQNASSSTPFLEESNARQLDHLFHYYKDPLLAKPISSYLVGWDFPLNPAQISSTVTAASNANINSYVWDQTILYQSVANKINVQRSATSNLGFGGIFIDSVDVTGVTKAALVQYVDKATAQDIFKNRVSVNVLCGANNAFPMTVSLWWTTAAALAGGVGVNLVTTLDANGHPSAVFAGWTEVTRSNNLGNATFTTGAYQDFGFSGWDLTAIAVPTNATYFAIVVGTGPIPYNGGSNGVAINSISLVPGDVPTRPAPQTADAVFRECQYFYEKTYAPGTAAGTNTGVALNCKANTMPSTMKITVAQTTDVYSGSFSINYQTKRASIPSLVLYAPDGTINNVYAYLTYTSGGVIATAGANVAWATYWNSTAPSSNSCGFVPVSLTSLTSAVSDAGTHYSTGSIYYHYVCDARLGLV